MWINILQGIINQFKEGNKTILDTLENVILGETKSPRMLKIYYNLIVISQEHRKVQQDESIAGTDANEAQFQENHVLRPGVMEEAFKVLNRVLRVIFERQPNKKSQAELTSLQTTNHLDRISSDEKKALPQKRSFSRTLKKQSHFHNQINLSESRTKVGSSPLQ